MKHVIPVIAALFGVALSFARPADACTRHTGVRDFTMFESHDVAQNLVFGMVQLNATTKTVGACNRNNNTLEFFWSGLNPEIHAGLPQDTRMCLKNGNDVVTVLRSGETTSCAGLQMSALNYNGKKLILVGMAGRDTITGGDGADVIDSYSGATASGTDKGAAGKGKDEMWFSSVASSTFWGGSGDDKYFSFSGAFTASAQDLSGNDAYNGGSTVDRFCDVDWVLDHAWCGTTAGDRINVPFSNSDCPYNAACVDLGSPPNGADR